MPKASTLVAKPDHSQHTTCELLTNPLAHITFCRPRRVREAKTIRRPLVLQGMQQACSRQASSISGQYLAFREPSAYPPGRGGAGAVTRHNLSAGVAFGALGVVLAPS